MRIVLVSALLIAAVTLPHASASAQEPEISAKAAYATGDYATALRQWRSGAEAGDAKAQVNLGRMYALGHGVDKDEAVAISWFRKAADQGSAVAHHNLGVMYETGADRNLEAAASHYRVAAEDGWTESQTALAKLYQHGLGVARDYGEAARWFEEAADDNDPEAQFVLGVFYANGWGVERDLGEMLRWTRRSARQGHPKALFHIGLAYDRGLGIGRNPASAARFYAVAAKKGNTRARSRLGEMYFHGIGVKQSYPAAFALLTRAAAEDDAPAQYLLGYAHHTGKGVARNAERGVAYYRRAADQGHPDARNKLAVAYDTGDGVAKNPEKANELYRIGADGGDAFAQYSIGLAYRSGRGVGQDQAEAVRWFLRAARGGHGDAQLALARMYRDGIGVGRNDRAALRWIDEAVRGGNAAAIAELAELHFAGRGVARDPERAIELLRQAAETGLRSAAIRYADRLAEGRQVPRDLALAAKWYQRLAEAGDAHGTSMLAALHLTGEGGLAHDPKRAAELFRIAANLGSAHAAAMLAALHYDGRGIEKNYAKAARWYKAAAAQGDYAANYALGNMYRHGLGVGRDLVAADRHYASALAIRERKVGRDFNGLTDVLRRLAELSHHRDLYVRAATYYGRAVVLLRGAEDRRAAYLEALTGLAAVYRDQGRLGAADAAITLALKSLGPGAEESAAVLKMGLGELYEMLGRDARAAEVYAEVLATIERRQGLGPGYRHVLAARGRVLAKLGRDDEADAAFTRALTLMEENKQDGFAAQHARALSDYGRLLTRLGHYGEAVATFEKGEKLVDRAGLTQHPRGLAGAADFALAYERESKIDSAISVLRRATRAHALRNRRMARAIAPDPQGESRLVHRTILEYVRLLTKPPVSGERVAEAFDAAQGARSLRRSATMEQIVGRLAKGDGALGRLLDARRRTTAAWRRMERRLVGAEAGSGRVDPEVLRNGFKDFRTLERVLDRQDATLVKRFPDVAAMLSLAPVGLDEARQLLGADEALVATLSGRNETHVWVLTKTAALYHRVALGAARIARMVGRLRAGLDPGRGATADRAEPFPLGLSAELYRLLFGPVHAALEGVSHVFYMPDGALRNLPLSVLVVDLAEALSEGGNDPIEFQQAAMRDRETSPAPGGGAAPEPGFARYREVVWFIDKHAVSRIPSLNALRALRSSPAASRAPEQFVGIGEPAFADQSKLRGLRQVVGTAGDLREMARSLGAGDDKLYLGAKATVSAIKALALKRYRTVAFATRGVLAGEPSGGAEPALVMTPPTDGAPEDGLLTASEIARLDLDADLVVLGAVPADRLSGLAESFFHAGARALMVSLWPVERAAATALTTGMFAKRNDGGPQGPARLLQRAALEILNDESRPARFAHPMYWGGFVIVGDGSRRD